MFFSNPPPSSSSPLFSLSRLSRPLTQLFRALAVTCKFSQFHQGIEVAFGSDGYS